MCLHSNLEESLKELKMAVPAVALILTNLFGEEWSGRRDSNSQPLAPKASALPIAPRPDLF